MSEQILEAIVRLLAIVAREDNVTLDEKASIANFLVDNVSMDDAANYLQLFEQLAEEQAAQSEEEYKKQIDEICNHINAEQTSRQKMIIVLHLIQLIAADGTITKRENELVYYIGERINISINIIDLVKAFVIYQERSRIISSNVLILDNGNQDLPDKCKHLQMDTIEGFIFILRIPELDVYFAKYIGEEKILMNDARMRHNHIYVLANGAIIKTEQEEKIFQSDIVGKFLKDQDDAFVSLKAEKVGFKFKNGGIGLRDINISEEGGKLIAIMGGSGAGKSTLLNVLNGNEKPSEGTVRVNGKDFHANKSDIIGAVGYIPQDDLLIEELTVYENLFFSAKLCFDDKTDEELKDLTIKTIESLGLLEAKDLKVGSPLDKSISGGQRKRVNIGLELLREPSILFVDEPTSGLSSRDSENIMELLKDLSLKGKMIYVVIHQPSEDIYKMFDKLILLDVGGYQIYYGNPIEAIKFFKESVNMVGRQATANPEQIFNIVESKVVDEFGNLTKGRKITPEQWYKEFKNKISIPGIEEASKLPPKTMNIPGRLKQFLIFSRRDVLSKLSNRQYLLINSLEAPFLAFLLAGIIRYSGAETEVYNFRENLNIPVYFFMSIIVALFMGLTVSAEEIIRDRKILKREEFLNLSRFSYLGSKIAILFFISAVQTFTYTLIGNWILGVEGMNITMWIILFSVSCFANILGLNISASLKSAVTVYILIPLLIIPQLILSGVVVDFDKLNPVISNKKQVPLIGEIMASRWAFEGLAVAQYRDNKYESIFYEYDKVIAQSEFKNVYLISNLETRLEYINNNYQKENRNERIINSHFQVMRNEINQELFYIGNDKFPEASDLTIEKFNNATYVATQQFLEKLKAYYNLKSKKANKQKEVITSEFLSKPNGREEFILMRDRYQNQAISIIVKNTTSEYRIIEHDGQLIQKIYPIYHDPEFPDGPLDFRAHFFSPTKHFFGSWFDTVYFNILIIWSMILLLAITLYYNALLKLLKIFSSRNQ